MAGEEGSRAVPHGEFKHQNIVFGQVSLTCLHLPEKSSIVLDTTRVELGVNVVLLYLGKGQGSEARQPPGGGRGP